MVPGSDLRDAAQRQGSWWKTVKAVLWSFLGIRRSSAYADDVAQLNPLHVIIVGLVATALFVVGVWWLVQWIVDSGVAS